MPGDFGADDFRIVTGDAALARKDFERARAAYASAAQAGLAAGQHNLAVMYQEGLGVAIDYAAALKWYRKAAEQGAPPSQVNLGLMLYHGQGVAADQAEALKWIERGASQGFAAGEYVLGTIYENGTAVAQDTGKAFEWFERAARHGHPQAATRVRLRREEERERQSVLDAARQAGTPVTVVTRRESGAAPPPPPPPPASAPKGRPPDAAAQERLRLHEEAELRRLGLPPYVSAGARAATPSRTGDQQRSVTPSEAWRAFVTVFRFVGGIVAFIRDCILALIGVGIFLGIAVVIAFGITSVLNGGRAFGAVESIESAVLLALILAGAWAWHRRGRKGR
jgi:hypothetical protein